MLMNTIFCSQRTIKFYMLHMHAPQHQKYIADSTLPVYYWQRVLYNVSVHFISQISQTKQNCETKGREYQLRAKIRRNYYSIWNCMVLIHQNKGAKIILCAKRPTFWADKLKGLQLQHYSPDCSTETSRWSVWLALVTPTQCTRKYTVSQKTTLTLHTVTSTHINRLW